MKEFHKAAITFGIVTALGTVPLFAQVEPSLAQPSQLKTEPANRSSSFRLPTPSGPYQVGTTSYYLVDSSRKETYSTEVYDLRTRKLITTPPPTDRRELMVYIWYPAKVKSGATSVPYIDEGFAIATSQALGSVFGVSPDVFTKLVTQVVRTNAISLAPLANAQKRYPVVFFSPGHGSTPKQYSSQLEQLASHGYVVVGINPTYETPVLLPDERVITQSTVFDFSSASKQTERRTFEEATSIRAKDVNFVLNQLQRLNVKDPQGLFSGHLDLSQVGIFGHSLGANTAVEAMRLERRIKAGISMDSGEYGELFNSTSKDRLDRPFMVMSRENQEAYSRLLYQRVSNDAYSLIIRGSRHNTFIDFGLILPLFSAHSTQTEPPIKQTLGSIEPQRAAKIINTYTLAFFDKYLKNQNSLLLRGASSNYPEVVLESRRKASVKHVDCKAALKAQQRSLSFSFDAFDQKPHQGWRRLGEDLHCYREAAQLITRYLNTKTKLTTSDIEILSFHAGQMLAFNNDYESAIPFIEKSFSKSLPPKYKTYADAWDAYVNATIAFLERDKPALEAYRDQVAAGPKLPNGEVMNLAVVDRLIKNFSKPYRKAYGGR